MSNTTETWVFLRGLMRESGHWGNLLQDFHALHPNKNIISVDLPGTGTLFQETSPWTMEEYTEFVRRKVHPASNIKVFAVSLGGMIASDWIHRYPDEVAGVVLVNTSFRGFSPFFRRLRPSAVWTLLRLFFTRDIRAREKLTLTMVSNLKKDREDILNRWVEIQQRHPVQPRNAIRQIWAAARFRPPMDQPKAKILVLTAEHDNMVHSSCSKRIAEKWGLPIKTHPTAGHDLPLEDPVWILDSIRNF